MVTREQALTARNFHYGDCQEVIGPRGGRKVTIERWRRNGQTKTWKTRPTHFSVPIKYGMWSYAYLDQDNAERFHVAEDCNVESW